MAKKAKSRPIQEFYYRAPEATSVQLVGDFTHWQKNPIQMQKQSDGTWKVGIALLPGTHHYRFLVDGEWSDDPDCTIRVQNVFGSQDMVREVQASEQGDVRASRATGRASGSRGGASHQVML